MVHYVLLADLSEMVHYVDNYANVHKVLSCGRENNLRNDLLKNSCKK